MALKHLAFLPSGAATVAAEGRGGGGVAGQGRAGARAHPRQRPAPRQLGEAGGTAAGAAMP